MARRLQSHTSLMNPETGETVMFEPGTEEGELPEWAQGKIDNESAWVSPNAPESPDDVETQDTGGGSEYANYTVPDLVDMARERGLEMPSGAKKAELIAALEVDDAS